MDETQWEKVIPTTYDAETKSYIATLCTGIMAQSAPGGTRDDARLRAVRMAKLWIETVQRIHDEAGATT